jgi:hypothetical protein
MTRDEFIEYAEFHESLAHAYSDGRIMRFGSEIGHISMLEPVV